MGSFTSTARPREPDPIYAPHTPPELWDEAKLAVLSRIARDEIEQRFATPAMAVFEPGWGEPAPSEQLAALQHEFALDAAERLARADPDHATRAGLVKQLLRWVASDDAYAYSADRVERLADDLGITVDDLGPRALAPSSARDNLRALARSARRRCDGERWRAFLRDQVADPAPSSP